MKKSLLLLFSLLHIIPTATAKNKVTTLTTDNNTSLITAFEAAQNQANKLRAAVYARMASEEKVNQRRAKLSPQITINSQYQERLSGSNTTGYGYQIQMTQTLFDRVNSALYQSEKMALQRSDSDLIEAESKLFLEVAHAYLNYLALSEKLSALAIEKQAYEAQLEHAKALFKAGEATVIDTYDAESSLDTVNVNIIKTTTEFNLSKNTLIDLTGIEEIKPIPLLSQDFFNQPINLGKESDWINRAIINNNQLKSDQFELSQLNEILIAEKGQYAPKLSLNAGYRDNYEKYHQRIHQSESYIGITLSMDLFNGGETNSRVREQEANLKKAQSLFQADKDQVILQIKQHIALLKGQMTQIKAQEKLQLSTTSKLEATHLGRIYGIRSSIDELNAEKAQADIRSQLIESRYQYLETYLTLLHLSGLLQPLVNYLMTNKVDDITILFDNKLINQSINNGLIEQKPLFQSSSKIYKIKAYEKNDR